MSHGLHEAHIGRNRTRTRGRADGGTVASVTIVAIVLILALGGLGAWFALKRSDHARLEAVSAEVQMIRAQAEHAAAARVAAASRGALEAQVPSVDPDRPLAPPDPNQFDGRGSIRGTITVPEGQTLPRAWTIELVPSTTLVGGNRAEYRRQDFENSEHEFAFDDLPLGGYELLITTTGLQAPPWHLLLAKNSADALVSIGLKPMGRLEGRVVDVLGLPVDQLPLFLKPLPRGSIREEVTDAAGAFLFEGVTDGNWQLLIGAVTNPLVPALDIEYSAPGRALQPIEVPELGAVEITVLDEVGSLVAGAQVSGYGQTGGIVRVETDQTGRASVRFLPPGLFKLFATHDISGSVSDSVTVEAGRIAELTVKLAPR